MIKLLSVEGVQLPGKVFLDPRQNVNVHSLRTIETSDGSIDVES